MKGVGMLVVSLRGINFGCWSHLACAGQNAIIFSREGLDQDCTRKIYIFCVLSWSLSGVKKSLGPFQIGLLQGFNLKFPTSIPTPFICGVPPGKILRTFVWWGAQTCPPPHHTNVCIHCFCLIYPKAQEKRAGIACKVYYNPTAGNTPTKWTFS